MKILLNHADLDAVGILVINNYFNINFDRIYIINYEDIHDEDGNFILPEKYPIQENDELVVTDLSLIPDFLNYIKTAKSFIAFDHHDETGKLPPQENIIYDKHKSGSLLYFEYITQGKRVPYKLKQFIDLVNTYDTFNDESPLWEEAQNLNRLFYKIYSYGLQPYDAVQKFITFQQKKFKNTLVESFYFSDYEKGKIAEVLKQEADIYIKAKKMIKVRKDNVGHNFGVLTLASKISITCFNLLKEYSGLSYIIVINSYKGINGKVSVRAQKHEEINVNYLTGIKGHEKAGGGQFPIDFLQDFWESNSYFDYVVPESK
jgi:hypothetical protein